MARFFSCDWGTTSFRLRLVDGATGRILAERQQPTGAKSLFMSCASGGTAGRERAFAEFLCGQLRALEAQRTTVAQPAPHPSTSVFALGSSDFEVVVSGMASSSIGWRELPYAQVPVALDGSGLVQERFDLRIDDQKLARIHLISGVRSESDIMRGEEVEIIGLFANDCYPAMAEDGWVVLPGTHSKHVRLQHRQLTAFTTYMTGELFEVLATHSLLKASVEGSAEPAPDLRGPACRDAFVAGVRRASSSGLAGSLFQTRVRTVLQGIEGAVNRWFLSGLLIGAELCEMARADPALPILLAAPAALSDAYTLAFEALGFGDRVTIVPPAEMALALTRGHATLLRCLSVDTQRARS